MDPPAPRSNLGTSHEARYHRHLEQQPHHGSSSAEQMYLNPPQQLSQQSSSAKRRAQVGQWTTPPHPIFPSTSGGGGGNNNNNVTATDNVNQQQSQQDYAIQDAYHRGTMAAATSSTTTQPPSTAEQQAFYAGFLAAQQQQQQQVVQVSDQQQQQHGTIGEATAALSHQLHESCPNFSNLQGVQQQQHHAPPPPQPLPHMFQQHHQHTPPASTVAPYRYPYPHTPHAMPSPTSLSRNNTHHPAAPATHPETLLSASNNRSTSLPNISSYAARASHQEDEKRSKRLARNRASARQRRLKKKNLVESYEGEVKVLSSCLEKLQNHNWGNGNNNNKGHDILLQALSMDRGGQQHVNWSVEERNESITDVLKQQCEHVDSLLDVQSEFMMLSWFLEQQQGQQDQRDTIDDDEKEVCAELEQLLQLSTAQKQQLNQSLNNKDNNTSSTVQSEYESLTTIKQCLTSLLENEHLINPAVDDHTNELMSIFHPTQLSRFLLWTDHNSDAIDQLDYVNANRAGVSSSGGDVGHAPKFVFGIDDEGIGGHGDD